MNSGKPRVWFGKKNLNMTYKHHGCMYPGPLSIINLEFSWLDEQDDINVSKTPLYLSSKTSSTFWDSRAWASNTSTLSILNTLWWDKMDYLVNWQVERSFSDLASFALVLSSLFPMHKQTNGPYPHDFLLYYLFHYW